jgi:hypothetical protein
MEKYYTYVYYDPTRNNEPIYVGKGFNNRAWHHLVSKKRSPFISRIKHIMSLGFNPIIALYAGLDEEFAFFLEEQLILHFGRKDLSNGTLLNLTNGGEGNSGRIISDREKELISSKKEGLSWEEMYGVENAKLRRERLIERNKSRKGRQGTSGMSGKKHSEETKNKIRETLRKKYES